MAIADLAASAVRSITRSGAKKLAKKTNTPKLEKVQPIRMKNKKDNYFCAGFAKKEVMPEDLGSTTYWLAGFRMGNKVEGVIDPTTVSAMWLDCKDNGGIIMVSADIIGLTGYEVKIIRDSLKDFSNRTNCRNISVSCTHTHAGIDTVGYWGKLPRTGKNKKYMDYLLKSIEEVCVEAYENRTEGKVYVGYAHAPEMIEDRREPIYFNDRLTRIRFVPNNGSNETWILNFNAHPNTLGGDNSKISADYPGYIRKRIAEDKQVNVLFMVGANGALDISHKIEDCYERTVNAGNVLGEAALKIDNEEEMPAEMTVLRQPYYAPVDNGVLAFMSTLRVCNSIKYPYDDCDIGIALLTEMDYIKIGKQNILTLPGEIFNELVYPGHYSSAENSATGKGPEINPVTLSEIIGDENLMIFGVTNDMTGYIVPPNDFILHKTQAYLSSVHDKFDRNHYHETNSLAHNISFVVADTFKDLVSRL